MPEAVEGTGLPWGLQPLRHFDQLAWCDYGRRPVGTRLRVCHGNSHVGLQKIGSRYFESSEWGQEFLATLVARLIPVPSFSREEPSQEPFRCAGRTDLMKELSIRSCKGTLLRALLGISTITARCLQ